MPRIPEYRAGGTASIPGPGSIPVPRATPSAFGATGGKMLERAGGQISNFALEYVEKKATENANIFVSKALSDARTEFTQDFINRRSNATGDISADFDAFMQTRAQELIAQSPNDLATSKLTLGLNQMRSTFGSKSIIFDDKNRQARSIDTFGLAHNNRLGVASADMSQLPILLAENVAEGNKLLSNVDPLTREKLIRDNGYAIGESAIKGLIIGGRSTNDQAIKLLSDSDQPWKEYLQPGQAQKLLKEAESQRRTHLAEDRAQFTLNTARQTALNRDETERLYDMAMVAVADPSTRKEFAAALANTKASPSVREYVKKIYRYELTRSPEEDIPLQEKNIRFVELFDATENIGLSADRIREVEIQLQQSRLNGYINDDRYKMLTKRLMRPVTQQEKVFLSALKTNLIRGNPLMGIADPEGHRLYSEAVAKFENKKTELTDQNIPISVLFDPKSEHNKLVQELLTPRSPTDIMRGQIQLMTQKPQTATKPGDKPPSVTVPLPPGPDESEEEDPAKKLGRRLLGLPK